MGKEKKIPQVGRCSSLHGYRVGMCVLLGALGSSGGREDIHLLGWSLLKVGVVRKGIDVLLDHLVAELVLLLRRRRGHRNSSFRRIQREVGGRRWDQCNSCSVMNSGANTIINYESPLGGGPGTPAAAAWTGGNIKRGLTSVCTMWGLCSLRLLTVWNTSRMPSAFTLSRTVLNAQKVPVRPAPALYG